ncbi:MAG: hypothetical protein ACREDR_02870, partial [Blastocatellia bacterium]
MSTEAEIPQLSSAPGSKLGSGSAVNVDAGELVELSVRGLLPMFDSSSRQFCFRMVQTPAGLRREGLSHRYTVITLLGLCELERAGTPSPFPISSILEQLLEDKKWPVGAGDFGLLLWLTSIRAPEKLPALLSRFNLRNALDAYADVRAGLTMELAWLLTGLSRAILSARPELPGLADLARTTYSALVKNQGRGFFGHVSTSKTIAGRLRGWMGSFADQVYPILAMTRYSQAFESREALSRALECGRAICRVQGPLGQWWWHYDSRAGKVASMYPVFS